ncbi:copper chaperone [Paraburkholderia sediminicola]|uniref:copper chaperone n=1 Tax=Paraburkholderia sediminicola TaxID=458836 RepID=UPI0038B9F3D8
MEFKLNELTGNDDVTVISHAVWTVDPDAKVNVDVSTTTVEVDSWLMPEEFLVAFDDAGYEVKITRS